jgi:hypothetical protein
MTNKTYIIYAFLITSFVNAQYRGGQNDGSDLSLLTGSKLNGGIASFSVMYQGSDGDGHDTDLNQVVINGSDLMAFSGSSGDGFSQNLIASTISGSAINDLYYGNMGDGFSQATLQSILEGQDLSILFAGNYGDGADAQLANFLFLQGFMSDLFQGGHGDGHSSSIKFDNYLSGLMLMLFNGGSGDGFAFNTFNTALTLDLVEQFIKMEALLYPNPASGIVTIRPSDGIIITSIQLFDISGNAIKMQLSNNNTIDVSLLSDGIYLINIFSDTGSVIKKLIVKK